MLFRTVVILAALSSGGLAFAQPSTAPAPAKGSTGPTVPDTRPVDQSQLNPSAGLPATTPKNGSVDPSGTSAGTANRPADKP